MPDYPVRLFTDAAQVRRIGTGLLEQCLPRAEWTHEAHLAACVWLLTERPDVLPERDLPAIIRSYNEAVGGVNDGDRGTVGMPDQQRPLDTKMVEQLRQHIEGLPVHEVRLARPRQPVGLAIAAT